MTGRPWVTRDRTTVEPPNTDWVVTRPAPSAPSALTSMASVTRPDPSRTASRPATSLPSGVDGIRTAAGDPAAMTAASRASVSGATTKSADPAEPSPSTT